MHKLVRETMRRLENFNIQTKKLSNIKILTELYKDKKIAKSNKKYNNKVNINSLE
jgi:hypothetical protein